MLPSAPYSAIILALSALPQDRRWIFRHRICPHPARPSTIGNRRASARQEMALGSQFGPNSPRQLLVETAAPSLLGWSVEISTTGMREMSFDKLRLGFISCNGFEPLAACHSPLVLTVLVPEESFLTAHLQPRNSTSPPVTRYQAKSHVSHRKQRIAVMLTGNSREPLDVSLFPRRTDRYLPFLRSFVTKNRFPTFHLEPQSAAS